MKRDLLKTTKYDFILAGLILIISAGSVMSFKDDGSKALIYINDSLTREVDLHKDSIINLEKMILEVKDGGIKVLSSDCPRRICINSGVAKFSGQTIVCVPNRILIQIEGKSDEVKYNALSY